MARFAARRKWWLSLGALLATTAAGCHVFDGDDEFGCLHECDALPRPVYRAQTPSDKPGISMIHGTTIVVPQAPGVARVGNGPSLPGVHVIEAEASNSTVTPLRFTKPADAGTIVPVKTEKTESSSEVASADPQVRIVAMVGNSPIYDREVREAVNQRIGELIALAPSDRAIKERQIYREELKRLVEREMILEDMTTKLRKAGKMALIEELVTAASKDADKRLAEFKKARGIPNDEEFKTLLRGQNLTLWGMRRHLERNFMMSEYVRNMAFSKIGLITLSQVRDYYEDNPEEFQVEDSVKWQDLFIHADRFPTRVEARQFAEQLRQRAVRGENFTALVKQYDHGDSQFRNGFGIGEKRGEILPTEVESVVFSLKAGEVGPLVEMDVGYHIVRVVERTYAGRKPFDEKTQTEIRKRLAMKISEREYQRIIDQLRPRMNVVYFRLPEIK